MSAAHFTDQNFDQEVLRSTVPVLVDFFATWCGPCKVMAPVIEQVADESGGKYKVGKLDVDENNVTASKYQVMSIPTFFIYKNGEVVSKLVGVQDKDILKKKLEELL